MNDPQDPPSTSHPSDSEPPHGGIWDLPVRPDRLAFYDFEMTGLDPDRDEILEIALWLPRAGSTDALVHHLVRSSVPCSPGAAALHGWQDGEDRARVSPTEALEAVGDALHDRVLVGHGVGMDLRFLSLARERHLGIPRGPLFAIDTLDLARRAVKAPKYTLEAITARLGLPPRRWHRASEDALGVATLFASLAPQFAPESLRDLWEVRVGQPRDRVRVRGAIARRLVALIGREEPVSLVVRQSGAEPRTIRGCVERWDAPHVSLRRANGHRAVVRADRILRVE